MAENPHHRGPEIRRPPQLSDEIASYIRDLIISGQLKSNEQVNIDKIARELDASATPVREALLGLRGEGWVRLEPRKGFRVAPLSPGDIQDLYEVHSYIAGQLASRAAGMLSLEELEFLELLQRKMHEAANDKSPEEVERLNYEFHRTINLAAQSQKLAWFLQILGRYVPHRFYSQIPGWLESSLGDHESVIEALKHEDAEAARQAMGNHILHAGELLLKHLMQIDFWSQERQAGVNR